MYNADTSRRHLDAQICVALLVAALRTPIQRDLAPTQGLRSPESLPNMLLTPSSHQCICISHPTVNPFFTHTVYADSDIASTTRLCSRVQNPQSHILTRSVLGFGCRRSQKEQIAAVKHPCVLQQLQRGAFDGLPMHACYCMAIYTAHCQLD